MAKSMFCSPIFSSAQGWHCVVRQLLPCPQQLGELEGHHATRRAMEQRDQLGEGWFEASFPPTNPRRHSPGAQQQPSSWQRPM